MILAIDTNIAVHEQQTAEWAKYGIGALRVDSVRDAAALLSRGGGFLFVAVNEDAVLDLPAQLPVLRAVADVPIFVKTSSYTVVKKIEALRLGADVYEPSNACPAHNVLAALELLKAQLRRASCPVRLPLLIGGDVILFPSRRDAFVRGKKVPLTKTEFDILQLLMENSGRVLTFERVFSHVWGRAYGAASHDMLWNNVSRLRRKLRVAPDCPEYIENVRDVGYRFLI